MEPDKTFDKKSDAENLAKAIEEKAAMIVEIAEKDDVPLAWVPVLRRAARILEKQYSPAPQTSTRKMEAEAELKVHLVNRQ